MTVRWVIQPNLMKIWWVFTSKKLYEDYVAVVYKVGQKYVYILSFQPNEKAKRVPIHEIPLILLNLEVKENDIAREIYHHPYMSTIADELNKVLKMIRIEKYDKTLKRIKYM